MPRKGTCAVCDEPIALNASSLPQGEATCRACRRATYLDRHTPNASAYSRGCRCNGCRAANTAAVRMRRGIQPTRECGICGAEFTTLHDNERVCSAGCRLERKREHRSTRRALLRGAETGDRVIPLEIHQRDGWRCHICRRRLSPARAWPHPRSASIDHVIPLARGGPHEPSNVRTACLTCNLSKCDRGGNEQLLLIG